MLRLENASKAYSHRGARVVALAETSLEFAPGSYTSIVGPSGSGKSTLLLMLGGMLSPSAGRVLLDGTSMYDLSSDRRAALRRAKIGYVFQTFNLIPYLTALENVQVPLYLAGWPQWEHEARGVELLDRVGLGDRLHHRPGELSVGQQQRVALARMLAGDPAIILADEPTGNLDPETAGTILSYFDRFHSEGKTIVLVTHDPEAAARAGEHLRLIDGRVEPVVPTTVNRAA